MNSTELELLKIIADMDGKTEGAYNIRANGQLADRHITENVEIRSKTDNPGIDIIIKPGAENETVHIPVIISETGLTDLVYNDFIIGDGADVTIIAGCGIHNCGGEKAQHDGIHTFFVGKNAKIKYIEKHYGEGDGNGENIMNPTTIINIAEGGYMEMETTLIVKEKLMTHGKQTAETEFKIDLDGENSSTNLISRSVAKDNSYQKFVSEINGNNICSGHSECDAIIMDNGRVSAIPEITANNIDASLIHEAAIGKIAGDQIIKLMTLGLTEKQAEEQIINGFLK